MKILFNGSHEYSVPTLCMKNLFNGSHEYIVPTLCEYIVPTL